MKKECVLLFLIIVVIQISLTSAVKYECSDNSSISTDSEEISKGKVRSIGGIKIGLCSSYENRIHKLVESTILIDSNIVILENASAVQGINLKHSNSTIQYISVDNEIVEITLSGTTKEIETGYCDSIGEFTAMITNIEGTGSTALVEVLVGHTKKTLNTKQNSSEIVTINSKQYGITLTGGSSNSASVRVSTCRTGDLTGIIETINVENSTTNQTNITNTTSNNATNIENQTQVIQNITIKECESTGQRNSTQYCNTEGKYMNQSSSGQSCSNDYECISNSCKNGLCANKSLFSRIMAWIKGIFS